MGPLNNHISKGHITLPCKHTCSGTHLLTRLGLLKALRHGVRGNVGAGGLERVDGVGELGAHEARAAALLGRVVGVVGGGRVGLDGEF